MVDILPLKFSFLTRNTGNKSNEADALANLEIGRDYIMHIHKKEILTMNIFFKGYQNSNLYQCFI